VLQRQRPRPSLNTCDRLFWTTLRRIWPAIQEWCWTPRCHEELRRECLQGFSRWRRSDIAYFFKR
jgi:hypothetical protein